MEEVEDENKQKEMQETKFWWTFKAPSTATERVLQQQIAKTNTNADLKVEEIVYTFGGTNFPAVGCDLDPDDEGYVPALKEGAKSDDVRKYVESLPGYITSLLWREVERVAPHWHSRF